MQWLQANPAVLIAVAVVAAALLLGATWIYTTKQDNHAKYCHDFPLAKECEEGW